MAEHTSKTKPCRFDSAFMWGKDQIRLLVDAGALAGNRSHVGPCAIRIGSYQISAIRRRCALLSCFHRGERISEEPAPAAGKLASVMNICIVAARSAPLPMGCMG